MSANKLEWFRVIILPAQLSGTTKTANSLSGVILNNRESNGVYCSANVCPFLNYCFRSEQFIL